MSRASNDSGCACFYCERGGEIDRLKAENACLKARLADLELAVSPIDEQAVRLGRLGRDKAVSAIDPDMPRRFRWYSPAIREMRYGCYFPQQDTQVCDRATIQRGLPPFGEVTWIDPAPMPKDANNNDD